MRRGVARAAAQLACVALLVLGAACTTTTTTTSSAGPAEGRGSAEPADATRRAQVRLELASLYFGRGQHETALNEIKTALAAKPDLPEAYSLRGLVYAAMGDVRQADDSFQQALRMAPNDGNTMHNYGWFLCQLQRHPEAEAQFTRALAQPQYRDVVRTYLAQGVCQARAGRWAEAERTLSRAFELDPSNPATAYNLSEVLLRRGELERARFYIRRVNAVPAQATAASLFLAARIERRAGNFENLQALGRQLRERFPQAPETLRFESGRFDD